MAIQLKAARLAPALADGNRVLIDRRRPRGLTEEALQLRAWLAELAPSTDLHHWYRQRPRQFPIFRKRYIEELSRPDTLVSLELLQQLALRKKPLTLLATAPDLERSHLAILRDLLSGQRKPPATTGPIHASAASTGRAKAARRR